MRIRFVPRGVVGNGQLFVKDWTIRLDLLLNQSRTGRKCSMIRLISAMVHIVIIRIHQMDPS